MRRAVIFLVLCACRKEKAAPPPAPAPRSATNPAFVEEAPRLPVPALETDGPPAAPRRPFDPTMKAEYARCRSRSSAW